MQLYPDIISRELAENICGWIMLLLPIALIIRIKHPAAAIFSSALIFWGAMLASTQFAPIGEDSNDNNMGIMVIITVGLPASCIYTSILWGIKVGTMTLWRKFAPESQHPIHNPTNNPPAA